MEQLDALLTHLASQTDTALQEWALQANRHLTDEGAWLSLEHSPYTADPAFLWACGYHISPDEWAFVSYGATPTEAALALERLINEGGY